MFDFLLAVLFLVAFIAAIDFAISKSLQLRPVASVAFQLLKAKAERKR